MMVEDNEVQNFIQNEVKTNPVVLFMKGNELMPQCGFSARVVYILQEIGVSFVSHDVLQSDELREAIKTFSNWPTIPQLYVNGEFIGGCDIVTEMYQTGELQQLLGVK